MKGHLFSSLRPQSPGYAGIWRQFSRCEGRDRCGVHAAWPSAFRICATCILSGTHTAKLLTTPLYRLPFSSKPLKSLAELLRNRHGARPPPQPSRAGRGRLTRATGGRTIGAGRVTADAEAATANPTPPADQPASPETLRLYAADWAAFEDWCRGRALATLPADPATVAAFLTAGAETLGAGALGRRAAAIAAKHRQVGLASPAADPTVTAFLHAARRSATPRRPPPEQPAALIRMAARCPRDLAGGARPRPAAAGGRRPRPRCAGRPRRRAYPLHRDGGRTPSTQRRRRQCRRGADYRPPRCQPRGLPGAGAARLAGQLRH